jgi:hypothetical protein
MTYAELFCEALLCAWLIWLVYAIIHEKKVVFGPRTPKLTVKQTGRNTMAVILTYVITAAAPADADVVQRELVSAVNGEVVSTTVWAGTAVDLGTLSAEQDAQVSLSLVDIDDAGNRSMPATVTFVAADTIPPSAPGGLGVMLVGETRTDS